MALREPIDRSLSPEAAGIAKDLTTLSGKNVTVQYVKDVALQVCKSRFTPEPLIRYVRDRLAIRSPLSTLALSDRVLFLASSTSVCTRSATADETRTYQQEFFSFVLATSQSGPTPTALLNPLTAVLPSEANHGFSLLDVRAR